MRPRTGLVVFVLAAACGPKTPAEAEPKSVVVVPQAEPTEDKSAGDSGAALPAAERKGGAWTARLARCKRDPNQTDLQAAKQLFQDGVRAYEEGDYAKVSEIFAASYEKSCAAPVLFNLGVALERSGDRAGALEVYELYLEKSPDAPHAKEVQRRIDSLRQAP